MLVGKLQVRSQGLSTITGGMAHVPTYLVKATWDDEARVWVATSDDVPGLVSEAETFEQLREKVLAMIPELLELNGSLGDPRSHDVPISLIAQRDELLHISE